MAWAANNTAKLRLRPDDDDGDGVECWTLMSTNAYGQRNKVPQERIPDDVQDKVGHGAEVVPGPGSFEGPGGGGATDALCNRVVGSG